jgi:hypothetical protein
VRTTRRWRLLMITIALSMLGPNLATAQARSRAVRRPPRPVAAARPYYYRPAFYRPYYRPYYYSPYYSPYFYRPYYFAPFFGFYGARYFGGWGPYGYYPFYPYSYPYPYYTSDYDRTAARLLVTPRDTEVYVDGYLAGVVDDFDGNFQRLRLPPGGHEIVLYRAGHRTHREKVYLSLGTTFKVRHTMVPLGAGDPPETRPVPATPPPTASRDRPDRYSRRAPREADAQTGTLSIRVQPVDADVLIDGERWQLASGEENLEVQVSEGRHVIEVRREGYQSFSTSVEVGRGETTPLNVSLSKREQP